ncbi:Glutathione S-transferase-like protein gedE [Colletotrichum trifolii]|uniref:Glutathione S-transferase-like protein gedE n=1 Tax=Colletotrichum trifolii TaxID=5466 RepID=A0A4R8RVC3_COLTR|nr:Glutathione S-transferase-like protein gedE [Colletotrichum trifolii]
MSSIKPLVLYGHGYTPNPLKVVMILEELELPFDTVNIEMSKVKEEPYISVNPNGRLPALRDPNTDITLWESGAIIEYLVERYDTEHKISYSSLTEKFHLKQFLFFQVSGQGPYFGQLGFFKFFHPESIPSVNRRYEEQTVRVLSVLDKVLENKQFLVGDKATYADISFMPYDYLARLMLGSDWNDKYDVDAKYPNYVAWAERVKARPVVARGLNAMKEKKAEEDRAKSAAQ